MYKFDKINSLNFIQIFRVATILNICGKDMSKKYNLHHWENSYLKSIVIVIICALKNDVYLVYDLKRPVASFMIKEQDNILHFEKLATLPIESGKGIGTLCINRIEEIAKKRGFIKVAMEVYEASEHAILFYKHKGYKAVGKRRTRNYIEIKMEKSIL